MPDDLQTVIQRAREHATISMADVAILLTTSLHRIYGMAQTGSVAGVPVIRVGSKNLRCASRPLLRLIGELDANDSEGGTT
jgi:hypothetical protein